MKRSLIFEVRSSELNFFLIAGLILSIPISFIIEENFEFVFEKNVESFFIGATGVEENTDSSFSSVIKKADAYYTKISKYLAPPALILAILGYLEDNNTTTNSNVPTPFPGNTPLPDTPPSEPSNNDVPKDVGIELGGNNIDKTIFVNAESGNTVTVLDSPKVTVQKEKNSIPVAKIFIEGPYETQRTLIFTAHESFDQDGLIQEYWWDFGDGKKAFGSIVTHEYWISRYYTVTLTVVDDGGLKDTESFTFFVEKSSMYSFFRISNDITPPKIIFNGERTQTIFVGESINAFPVVAYDDVDGDLTAYIKMLSTNYIFTKPGAYSSQITVSDFADNVAKEKVYIHVILQSHDLFENKFADYIENNKFQNSQGFEYDEVLSEWKRKA